MKKKNLLMTAIAIFGLATITNAQVPSYVPTNGLVGWWPFNGNANDESGNGNNGTVNGATLTTDRFGNANSAFSFDGVDDFIELGQVQGLNSNGGITLSVWMKFLGANNTTNSQFVFLVGGNPNSAIIVEDFNNTIRGNVLNCNCQDDISVYQENINNDWHHAVLTYDLNVGIMNLYLDGNLVSTSTENMFSYYTTNNPNERFGNYHFNSHYFKGLIDDGGIWNRALTQQEVTELYNGCQLSVNAQPNSQTININNNAQFIVGSSDLSATFQWQTDLGVGFQNLNSIGQYSGTTTTTLTVANVTMSNNNQPFRCVITSGSCSDTSEVVVLTVNNNVGINEFTQDNLFSVYPNPAKSQINVKADAKLLGSIYTVYDNTGKVVLSGKIISENTTIELGNLSGGIYLFSVGENLKQTFKVIKE